MKTEIARKLSQVEDFRQPRISLEQYMTPPQLAADLVYAAYMRGDIENQEVVDLGAGTGMLAIGAALASGDVTAVEKDREALEVARENAGKLGVGEDIEFVESDIEELEDSFDTVIMNPPFSVHSDTGFDFIGKALEIASATYFIALASARERIKDFVENSTHEIEGLESYTISLPATYGFHTSENEEVEVDLVTTRRTQDGA
ncbi:MAG: METTL5 family protein [Candidatus Nanohaloarchaea archaeon]